MKQFFIKFKGSIEKNQLQYFVGALLLSVAIGVGVFGYVSVKHSKKVLEAQDSTVVVDSAKVLTDTLKKDSTPVK